MRARGLVGGHAPRRVSLLAGERRTRRPPRPGPLEEIPGLHWRNGRLTTIRTPPKKGAAPGSPEILAPHRRIGDQSGSPCNNVRTSGHLRESEFCSAAVRDYDARLRSSSSMVRVDGGR